MERYRAPPKAWRTTSLKNKMIRKIEDAIMYCSESLPENAGDMERRAFLRCDTKRKYLRDIDRIIDYIDGITMASLVRKQLLEQDVDGDASPEEDDETQESPENQLETRRRRKRFNSRLKRALRIPDSRIRMSKMLKMRSEDYLRKIKRQGKPVKRKLQAAPRSSRLLRMIRNRRRRRLSSLSNQVDVTGSDGKQRDASLSDGSSTST